MFEQTICPVVFFTTFLFGFTKQCHAVLLIKHDFTAKWNISSCSWNLCFSISINVHLYRYCHNCEDPALFSRLWEQVPFSPNPPVFISSAKQCDCIFFPNYCQSCPHVFGLILASSVLS